MMTLPDTHTHKFSPRLSYPKLAIATEKKCEEGRDEKKQRKAKKHVFPLS